jgi:hypothetical protein
MQSTVVTGYCSFLEDRLKDDPGASDDIGQIRRGPRARSLGSPANIWWDSPTISARAPGL